MNKKGFTLIELLVVIIILSLLLSVATISITKYRKDANEKEKTALKQTIISAFENYRITTSVKENTNVNINNFNFNSKLSYDKKTCSYDTSTIKYVIKKNNLDAITEDENLTEEQKTLLKEKLKNSLEEVFCVTFYCNDKLIINDSVENETNEILVIDDETYQFKINYCK